MKIRIINNNQVRKPQRHTEGTDAKAISKLILVKGVMKRTELHLLGTGFCNDCNISSVL
jgi:hypothetical protein